MLDSYELRQLRQRITVRWNLSPLTADESREYIQHRLRVAAGRECDLFTDKALQEIHQRAGGIPRLINVLCDRALLVGYAAGASRMDRKSIDRAAREILSTRSRRRPWQSVLRRAFPAAVLLGAIIGALSWFGVGNRISESLQLEAEVPPDVAVGPPVRERVAKSPDGVAISAGALRQEVVSEGAE